VTEVSLRTGGVLGWRASGPCHETMTVTVEYVRWRAAFEARR
jgi:hypothetical protein